jgi:Spy/CpxP family protein refolding chaperone
MNRFVLGLLIIGIVFSAYAFTESPYAGQEDRDIKALSPQEVDDYLRGRGLGYAKAAELNRYPGPRHVLDLAPQLGLSDEQIVRTEAIFAAMEKNAIQLGRQLVSKEQALNQAFAAGAIDADSLQEFVSEIGELDAQIRFVHLNAHLQQRALLTRHQIKLYDDLRGYGASHHPENHH